MGYRDRKIGHAYVMLNAAMPGLVKIGRTRDQTKTRARQLHSTGMPTAFLVLWQEFVHDSDEVEKAMHTRFKALRFNSRREFFKVEPQEAIRTLMEVARPYHFSLGAKSPRVLILDELKAKIGSDLRSDLVAVNVAQDDFREMFLEVVRVPADRKNKKQLIDYVDLNALGDNFTLRRSLDAVARKFVDLDILTLVRVTDWVKEDVAQRTGEEYERNRKEANP